MNILKAKLFYDNTINIDENTIIGITDTESVNIINSEIQNNRVYKYYSVLIDGVCILHNGEIKTRYGNIVLEKNSYDLYINGKMLYDISIVDIMIELKDNLDLFNIKNIRNEANCDIMIQCINTISFRAIRLDSLVNRDIISIYNTDGKEIYSFEMGLSRGIKIHDYIIKMDLMNYYDNNIAELKDRNRFKYTELLDSIDYKHPYAILNKNGNYIKMKIQPQIIGEYLIINDNKLCKIEDNKLVYKKFAKDYNEKTFEHIKGTDLIKVYTVSGKRYTIINVKTNREWHNVVCKPFKSYINSIVLIGDDYIDIIYTNKSEYREFRINDIYTTQCKDSYITPIRKEDGSKTLKIKVDNKSIYEYDGNKVIKIN